MSNHTPSESQGPSKQSGHSNAEESSGNKDPSGIYRDTFGGPALCKGGNGAYKISTSERARRLIEKKGSASETNEQFTLEDAPRLPDKAVDRLPPLLQKALGPFDRQHRRDIVLTGSLSVLSACLPKVRGFYGKPPEVLAPNLYTIIVASPASGKGVLRYSRRLGRGVDEHIRWVGEQRRRAWEEERKEAQENGEAGPSRPKPPQLKLFLPPDMSAAGFYRILRALNGRGCIYETEIDPLVDANEKEWGFTRGDLRKGFHHEPFDSVRADGEDRAIREPKISMVLSGTGRQFKRLIKSTESGLYSRLAVYYFDAPEPWESQRPPSNPGQSEMLFEELSGRVEELYRILAGREKMLWFVLEEDQWNRHSEIFDRLHQKVHRLGYGHLADVVKRAGVIAFRIAMILAVVRAFESETKLGEAKTLTATDDDVEAALALAQAYADHALRFSTELPGQPEPSGSAYRISRLLEVLPAKFSNELVYEVARRLGLGVSERTLRRDLKKAQRLGLLSSPKRGEWEKRGDPG